MSLSHLQWFLLASFLIPVIESVVALAGAAWAKFGYVERPEKFRHLILQITTVGREPELVQRTVDKLRSYALPMPHEIWIVIEPEMFTDYRDADEVIVVPESFTCRPVDKARALEYARLIRRDRGLNRADIKLLLIDDDTLPSANYVIKAFNGDYDVCQGITVPNRWYAVGGWRHFLLSHLDDIRTRNCLVYCSCTQGLTQYPLYVHGEGLCMTGRTEEIVTWDFPIVGSDDLVFGTNAACKGLSWGYFHGAIQLVSPWSFREKLSQMRRWTWGNFDAIGNRQVMPWTAAAFKAAKYVFGFGAVIASTAGVVLLLSGLTRVPEQASMVFIFSIVLWFGSYGVAGWINAGGEPNQELRPDPLRFWLFRITQSVVAALLTPLTALTPIVLIIYCTVAGRPNRFIMIKKSNSVMGSALSGNGADTPGPG
jgi:hypothetical protein